MQLSPLVSIILSVYVITSTSSQAKDKAETARTKEVTEPTQQVNSKASVGNSKNEVLEYFFPGKARIKTRPILKDFLKDASLVFHGKVINKSYGKSDPSDEFANIPLTFVTFNVIEVIAGRYTGDTFTIRHIGGPIDADSFTVPTHVTHFNIGDEDIISLNGNGELMDPVIGRIRIFDEEAFTAGGHRLVRDAEGNPLVSSEKSIRDTIKSIQIEDINYPSTNNLPSETVDFDSSSLLCKKGNNHCEPLSAFEIKSMINQSSKGIPKFSRKHEECFGPRIS